MKTAIVIFSGFREGEHASTGTRWLRSALHGEFSPEGTVFDVEPWDADVKELAARLKREKFKRVILIGYSWGGGFAVPRMAKRLLRANVGVPLVLLCDAVFRALWLPTWWGFRAISLRSVLWFPKIKLPDGIGRVAWVRQRLTPPRGHDISAGFHTLVLPPVYLNYGHTQIDNSKEWHSLAISEVRKALT